VRLCDADTIALNPHRLIDEFTAVRQRKFTHQITELSKKALNSFDQERLERPVSPVYCAMGPPLSPCRPGPPTTIDGHFEDLSTEKQEIRGTWKESNAKRGQSCMCIFSTVTCCGC
jgi:hypothetical protein